MNLRKPLCGLRLECVVVAAVLALVCAVGAVQAAAPSESRKIVVWDGETTRTFRTRFNAEEHLKHALPSLPRINKEIVRMMLEYPRDGVHDYWWPRKSEGAYDGATTDILLNGLRVMRGEPKGRSFCCGLTLEVCYRILGQQKRLPDRITSDTAGQFKKLWFCRNIDSPGPSDALLEFGMGKNVEWDDALPGDFVQLWRHNKSGHSVVFVGWARDVKGRRLGLHYWSTQPGTKGIGFQTEIIGKGGKTIKPDALVVTRLLPPDQWKQIAPGDPNKVEQSN